MDERPVLLIGDHTVSERETAAVRAGAGLAAADVKVVTVQGSGALECLQGLFTNDLDQAGEGSFVYGAVLTPKGMIVCDMWIAREHDLFTIFASRDGLDGVLEIFGGSLPPRLAKWSDVSEEQEVLRLVGPAACEIAERAGISAPESGSVLRSTLDELDYLVCRPGKSQPFELQITSSVEASSNFATRLLDSGATAASSDALEFARILSGWPRLGAEIGDKTLPQEVRFDDIDGVSYSKGCYTGQETVARVHFRGRPNRRVVGFEWEDAVPTFGDTVVERAGKAVGRISSAVSFDDPCRTLALGLLRREVDVGETVDACGAAARVVDLPFDV